MATVSVILLKGDYYSGGVLYQRGATVVVEEYEARRLVDTGDADYTDDIGPPEEAPENLPPWPEEAGSGGEYTDEKAQDAIGAMVDTTLVYADATPSLSRAALTGAVTAAVGSNTTALGSFTKAQLDGAVSDGNVLYVGDVSGVAYTDEMAQDAVGAMVDSTLAYADATPLLSRAALTGAVTAAAGSNATALGSFTKSQLNGAVSDGDVLYVGDVPGGPSLSQAVVLRTWPNLVFNDDSPAVATANSTALQAAHQYAYDNGKFVDGAFSDLGYLAINQAGVQIMTDWYGGYGPPPEIRYVGTADCITVTKNNVTIMNAHFNRPFVRPARIATMSKDAAGVTTVVFDRPHPYVVGSTVSPYDLGTEIPGWWGWETFKNVATVDPDGLTITINSGIAGVLTYDAARTATITAARRQGGKLILTAANHYFFPGQRISIPVTQHIKTGVATGATSPQTLNIAVANTSDGFRGYIAGVNTAGLARGYAVWTDTGELAGGTIINDIDGTTVYLNKLAVGNRTGASVQFTLPSMDVQRATIVRVPDANTFAVDQIGFDDTSPDVNGATAVINDTLDDRWACFRGLLSAAAEATKGLVVNGYSTRIIDCLISGSGIIHKGDDFHYQGVRWKDIVHTSILCERDSRRGKFIECHSVGPNGDDHFVVAGYAKNLNQQGEVQFINCSAHNCRHGTGLRAFGAYKLVIEGFVFEYCEAALRLEYDNANYFSRQGNTVNISDMTVRGCGMVTTTQMGTFDIPALFFSGGLQRAIVDDLDIFDSNNKALSITNGGGDYRFGRVNIDWNRVGPALSWLTGGTDAIGDTDFEDVTIRDSHEGGVYLNERVASHFNIDELKLEDINRSGSASIFGITVEGGLIGNINIGEVDWRNQKYTIGTPWLKMIGTTENHRVRVGSLVHPWHMASGAASALRQLPRGLQVVARTDPAVPVSLVATGDKAFVIMPQVYGLPWYPAGLWVQTNNGAVSTVTDTGTAVMRDAAAGGGNVIIAAGRAWSGLATNGLINLSRQFARIGFCASGSAVVNFCYDTSALAIVMPGRMDEVMPGMVITSTKFVVGTYVLSVDRANQTVTMSANAASNGSDRFTFNGLVPASSAALTSTLTGTGLALNLSVTVALAGSNLSAVHLFLIGRMT